MKNMDIIQHIVISVVGGEVQVRTLEKLASLGSRYSLIIREMRVINAAIYRNYAKIINHNAYICWHDDAKVAVWLW